MIRPQSWCDPRRLRLTRTSSFLLSPLRSYASERNLLRHHHLSGNDADGLVSYDEAHQLQEQFRAEFLAWKSSADNKSPSEAAAAACPQPRLLSFESTPTFTLGRRQEELTYPQAARLCRELQVQLPNREPPIPNRTLTPVVRSTNRGGLTTYHGPGQIVFWPVLDMHSPLYPRYGVASYASHLESATQQLLHNLYGIRTYTNRDEPGVWAVTPQGQPPRKIAALGVHHRRHVTALGIALNIDIPVRGDEGINPWARFVPCGLDGKLVTSVEAELDSLGKKEAAFEMATLANAWAEIFQEGITDSTKRAFKGD